MKLPMIRPRMRVARLSFFLAIRFLSFSASCSGVSLGGDGWSGVTGCSAGRTGLAAAGADAADVDATMLAVAESLVTPLAAVGGDDFLKADLRAGLPGALPPMSTASRASCKKGLLLYTSFGNNFRSFQVCLPWQFDHCYDIVFGKSTHVNRKCFR